MQNFPIFLDLKGKRIALTGGAALAVRKARLLLAAGADLHLISPTFEPTIFAELAEKVTFHQREPRAADFRAMPIVVIAEEDAKRQGEIAALARAQGALVNVVDAPDLCDFTTPSIIDRGDVVVAISTNGQAPVFGRNLRAQIEQLLPNRLEQLIGFAARYRGDVRARFGEATRGFWERFFEGSVAANILAGNENDAHTMMINNLHGNDELRARQGVVHIVGAGPGDPDLLTIKAHRLLQTADVILHDRLVSDDILNLARRDADRIFVGKAKSNHAVPQDEIHTTMIALAREGKTVIRLKGGDPFVFGRGGEELDALRAAGVQVHVTPGITAATGCAAATGMALTHRDYSQAVTFVTGHAKGEAEPDLDWQALADLQHTLVVYMGVSKADTIAERLIQRGRGKATPIAVIENGTRSDQIIARGTLGTLALTIQRAGIRGPAILVIGEVAVLADHQISQAINEQNETQCAFSAQYKERITA